MMAVDEMGDVYYALPFSHAIGGTGPLYPQGIYISGIEAPTGLAFDSDGNLIFSDFKEIRSADIPSRINPARSSHRT